MQAARKAIVKDLDAQGFLVEVEDREIELPHSDRSKTPIEPFLADQWFVKMDRLAQSAIDAVADGRIKIVPPRYAASYADWLAEKRDWPVSRQLWWGHRIPVWSKTCVTSTETSEVVAELEELDAFRTGNAVFQTESPAEQNEALGGGLVTKEALPHSVVHVCLEGESLDASAGKALEDLGFVREEDVLDTWFSSALWPHSTLGWPEQTPELAYYYPTSVLITSRDIITLWVARMALMSLNNVKDKNGEGEIPFREVFIHPKILDGYGETMSKSKGNGIDPLDVIAKFGADALRFGMARLTTETQDVRLPVQFECPHCETLVDQTKENREKPRVACPKCGKEFSTQWARNEADLKLPRAAVVSERFEQCRNFTNKLWNAARLILLNLNDFEPTIVPVEDLRVGDRWMLSRLQTVTRETTEALETFRYAEAARVLYAFAWDEFCSFYLEILKERLADEQLQAEGGAASRRVAQTMVAHALDQLLRLLHPMMPFITEEIWGLLAKVAPVRGYPQAERAGETIMLAPWPVADETLIDKSIEEQFALFQQVIGALREIRSRQNIPPRKELEFSLNCTPAAVALLEPMRPYFHRLASASAVEWGPDAKPPATSATVSLTGLSIDGAPATVEVYVDLKDFIDVQAEIVRNEKLIETLTKTIAGKERQLSNESFVSRAPAEVVAKERASLDDARVQLAQSRSALEELRKRDVKA
jgi:valyl-tRNA synthetase